MRSLALKLTLAFLLVGILGTILMAFYLSRSTRSEFDKFVARQDQFSFESLLTQYYQNTGSWQGIENAFKRGRFRVLNPLNRRGILILADQHGTIIVGGGHLRLGGKLTRRDINRSRPIEVNDEIVGYLLIERPTAPPIPGSPEADFLSRMNNAIIFSALGAAVIALLLGMLLARTISRPVREITAATKIVADGEFGHQVPVRTQDELGQLADSFNQMSTDLADSRRLRLQMTSDIAHDLRTPLSVILGYTEALNDGKLSGSSETFEIMHSEAQHLNHLIEDLRTLSLADAGELTLTPRLIDPNKLLERTASAYTVQAQERGISLMVDKSYTLPMVKADEERLVQVLENLVTNAIRFTSEGGEILLSAASDAQNVFLLVKDTGTGITPEDLPFIFERSFRGDKARHQNVESGLGLAIAKSLVEMHHGSLTVESTLGEGTIFTIELPISE